MIKFLVTTVLIALLSFVCGLYLPWWAFAGVAFAVSALIPQAPLRAFFSGFLALFLLWGLLALGIDAVIAAAGFFGFEVGSSGDAGSFVGAAAT